MNAPVPEATRRRSARIMGRDYGLTAVEMNIALKQAGFLEGEPGMYRVTAKGMPFADEQHHSRGTGGYPHYNPSWEQRTWDPSITQALDITEERRQAVRKAARLERQRRTALRVAQSVELANQPSDSREPSDVGVDAAKVAAGLAVGGLLLYGSLKAAPHIKRLWTEKAAPRIRNRRTSEPADQRLNNGPPRAGDRPEA